MAIFKLTASVTVTAYTTVEAENMKEAIKIADNRNVEIGGINSGYDPEDVWVIEDSDGMPMDIRVAD